MIPGEIVQLNSVLQLPAFLGVFGHGSEDALDIAVEFIDDAGAPHAVVGIDATEEKVEFSGFQYELAQASEEEVRS